MSENISLAKTKHCALKRWDASRPSSVFATQAGHPTSIILKLCHADRTPPPSVNLLQPSDPIARKMLSKGFGNK